MPYILRRDIPDDGARIEQASHWDTIFNSGMPVEEDFEPPVVFDVDATIPGRRMPTFFTIPAFVATRRFADDLTRFGVSNTVIYPAIVRDTESGSTLGDYVFIHIIGIVAAADVDRSEATDLGDGMRIIDRATFRAGIAPDMDVYRLAEDLQKIVISDRLQRFIASQNYGDVFLQKVDTP